MCGIVGLVDPRRAASGEEMHQLLERMASRMVERGPDGSGTWADEEVGVGFGHRRLSILDLSEHGAQPMVSRNGRWVITYNGEIYDHQDLMRDLDTAGVKLRGHSDTEMLVEAIALWGVEAILDRIDGMWAFGVWDREERCLTLARDRMGEKPLYYGSIGAGVLVFGSSLDALSEHPNFDRRIDHNALALYLRHKYVPAPWSIWEGIRKLEPGCTVEVTDDATVGAPRPYWSYFDVVERGSTFAGSPEDAVDELDRLLRRSLERRLIADVPVGAFLSGGIDSSTVVAIAQQVSNSPIRTFTIGSDTADFDESTAARAMAEHLGTDHTELVVTDADALKVVEHLGTIYDEPFGDSSAIPTRLVSQLARQDVTVALSGDAGDELFLGYNRYRWLPSIWKRLERIPPGIRSPAARVVEGVPPLWWDRAGQVLPQRYRPRMLGVKVAKVAGVADCTTPEEMFLRLVSHWQHPEMLVRRAAEPPTMHTDPTRWPSTSCVAEHMAVIDAVTYLPDDILAKVDRATMSVSLEGRVPLLDRSIVEFAASLPMEFRLRDGKTKWPMRRLLSRSVPAALFERPKTGFGVPLAEWLRGPLRDWAGDQIRVASESGMFNDDLIRLAWDQHQSGRNNHAYELWDMAVFGSWADRLELDPPTGLL
ncbi:MAG: asparagine synthase (glutamine-hydrolyzing) [Propioniciclava sp.]